MKFLVLPLALVLLTGCGTVRDTLGPIIETREVKVAVPVKCDVKVDMSVQQYADAPSAVLAAPNVFERGRLVLKANKQREARLAAVEPALRLCMGLPPLVEGAPQ